MSHQGPGGDRQSERDAMVDRQIADRGVRNERVLAAMRRVPREAFVPPEMADMAYGDGPLPIGEGQTISQPYIVALMAEAVVPPPDGKALDVGTGSGYAAAVLAELCQAVYSIERHKPLADRAAATLAELGYAHVYVYCGDGSRGWPDEAPFDAIIVAAGAPAPPDSLKHQLTIGGRLVVPVEEAHGAQRLLRITRTGDESFEDEDLGLVQFVPLVGEEGWADDRQRRRR